MSTGLKTRKKQETSTAFGEAKGYKIFFIYKASYNKEPLVSSDADSNLISGN